MGVTPQLRLLAWDGMPAPAALAAIGERLGVDCRLETIASNEDLERRLDDGFDLAFPFDYMVERLAASGRIDALDHGRLPGRTGLAGWARKLPSDPGCGVSVPLAFGTTGLLYDRRRTREPTAWRDLFERADDVPVGLLGEVREVVGAALIACGSSANAHAPDELAAAGQLLEACAPRVARCSNEAVVEAVLSEEVAIHQAWSGPAAQAVRAHPDRLGYAVPEEGAVLWVTTGAIPAGAPDRALAHAVLDALLDPEVACLTVRDGGFATPNERAQALLPPGDRDDPALFSGASVRGRCELLRDPGPPAIERIEELWAAVRV